MLTPNAISPIVTADEITMAAALTMLFAAIARARCSRSVIACSSA
jgi:hypothetical protein